MKKFIFISLFFLFSGFLQSTYCGDGYVYILEMTTQYGIKFKDKYYAERSDLKFGITGKEKNFSVFSYWEEIEKNGKSKKKNVTFMILDTNIAQQIIQVKVNSIKLLD
jgi:hypothetical protein